MKKLAEVKLTASVKYRHGDGKIATVTDYKVKIGDILVGFGTCGGKASQDYILREFWKLKGFVPSQEGMRMARECGLIK